MCPSTTAARSGRWTLRTRRGEQPSALIAAARQNTWLPRPGAPGRVASIAAHTTTPSECAAVHKSIGVKLTTIEMQSSTPDVLETIWFLKAGVSQICLTCPSKNPGQLQGSYCHALKDCASARIDMPLIAIAHAHPRLSNGLNRCKREEGDLATIVQPQMVPRFANEKP